MDPNIPYQQSFQVQVHQQTPRKGSGATFAQLPAPSPRVQHTQSTSMQSIQQLRQQVLAEEREWIEAPLDVEDALQFSPLSSIVPSRETSVIIPLPTINTTGQIPIQEQIGKNLLDNLSREAARDANSQTVAQALQEVSGYLKSHQGKKYKFKHPPVLDPSLAPPSNDNLDIPASIDDLIRTSKLGQFEGLLLKAHYQQTSASRQGSEDVEMVKKQKSRRRSSLKTVDPRNLQAATPISPTLPISLASPYLSTTPAPGPSSAATPYPVTPQTATPQPGPSFSIYVPQSTLAFVNPPQLQPLEPAPFTTCFQSQPQQSPSTARPPSSNAVYSPGGTRTMQSVVIASPPAFDRATYSSHPDVDQHVMAGRGTGIRKRKRAADDDDEEGMVTGVDYRAKAQAAFNSLQNLMANIFNAEDNMQADTSERITTKATNLFSSTSYDSDSSYGPSLTLATQVKLDSALQKVIAAGKFHLLPVDDLARLQKICENTLKAAEDVEIKFSNELVEGDSSSWDSWLGRVSMVDNALRTSMTCLRIMTGGRAEKQLYSEDLLQSILNIIKTLLDSCINQLVETRPSFNQQLFKTALQHRKLLNGVLHEIVLIFHLIARFINAEEVTDDFITKMEYICVGIIFIENASSEKDSVFGIQKVENLRAAAMDVLAIIFAKYSDQQKFIFDELLSNLEKLPTSKSGAKNFKLASGGDIQLITALILILIQTSGTCRSETKKGRELPTLNAEASRPDMSPSASQSQNADADGNSEDPEKNPIGVMNGLDSVVTKLADTAGRNASYVSSFMIQRAQNSSKTGETPYRNLLDLVINDLLTVLGLPDWPAAELMLRTIAAYMVGIVDDSKSQTGARGMALDVLTSMAVSLCDMRVHIRESRAKGEGLNEYDSMLQSFTKEYLSLYHEGSGDRRDERDDLTKRLMNWEGPFKLVLEQLWEKDDASNGSLRSSWGFFATLWGSRLVFSFKNLDPDDQDDDEGIEIARIGSLLRNIMKGNAWYDEQRNLDNFNKSTPTTFQLRHAYLLTVMTTPFCVSFEKIFERFVMCVESDSISTRNKGLKAIKQLIEKDPTILDRQQTVQFMMLRSEDPSAQVRDSAVDMIGTCLSFKPGLEDKVLPFITARVADTNTGVRKRAIRVSKEIYLHSDNMATKVRVVESLMLRVKDLDAQVADLAKKTFEELWINPSYAQIMKPSDDQREVSAKAMMIIKDRIDIIVKVAQGQDGQAIVHLNNVIQAFLDPENKQANVNSKVCKIMVEALFSELLGDEGEGDCDNSGKKDKQYILKTLTAFAQGSAKLFTVKQLESLQPYTQNLSQQDDLFMYRSVIIIFRCVLPSLSSAHQEFLNTVAKALLQNLSHLSHRELKEAIFCLATINRVFDISVRLVAVISSCFMSVAKSARGDTNSLEKPVLGRISRFLYIMGLLGMYCDFEKFKQQLLVKLKSIGINDYQGPVYELVVDTILKYCMPNVEISIRKSALESLGHVCKTHPNQYLRPAVLKPIDIVFASDDADLKKLVLTSILDFFMSEEKLSEDAALVKGPAASKESVTDADFDPGRLTGATAFAASHDGVSTALAQTHLKDFVKVALASNDEYALTAVEVIGSVLRQGLVHPKECTPALIALETSTHPRIEQIALKEHKMLAAKHESIVERSYMEGVRAAFTYQRQIIHNVEGTKPNTNVPILGSLYAMVQSNRKVRKKLLHNMVQSIDFDLVKFNPDADPSPIVYSRFIIYNLAFFEYSTIEDVQTVVQSLERLVTGTGTAVAHQLESDVMQLTKEQPEPVDPQVKKKLCAASIILMMAWSVRSHLRKLYGLNDPKRIKAATKDVTKTATRVQGVTPEPLRAEISDMAASMDSDLGQDEQCRAFIEMLNYDKDFKIAAENDEDLVASGQEDESDGGAPAATVPKKRKRATSPSAKKKKVGAKKHRASADHSD